MVELAAVAARGAKIRMRAPSIVCPAACKVCVQVLLVWLASSDHDRHTAIAHHRLSDAYTEASADRQLACTRRTPYIHGDGAQSATHARSLRMHAVLEVRAAVIPRPTNTLPTPHGKHSIHERSNT